VHIQGQRPTPPPARPRARAAALLAALLAALTTALLALTALNAYADLPEDRGKRRRPFHQWLSHQLTELAGAGMANMTDPGRGDGAAQASASWLGRALDDPDASDGGGFIGAPAVFYTPETSLLFGVGGMYYLPTAGAPGRVTQLTAAFAYTLKEQALLEFRPNIFWDHGRYHMFGDYRYSYFPDSFFGVGNRTRTADEERMVLSILRARSFIERRVGDVPLFLGLLYEAEYYQVLERQPGGILDTQPVRGREAATVSALGLTITYDSRDQTLTPTSGVFLYGSAALSTPELGASERFARYILDARHFIGLWEGHVLAWQAVLTLCQGDLPFQAMPNLGGGRLGRGYFGGRFRDKHMMLGQVEYRAHLWWRIGAAAFGGAGQVADTLAAFDATQWRPFGGAGLRFLVDPDAGATLRFDVGFGADSIGIYFDAGEAF
jgi:hypothetical protein